MSREMMCYFQGILHHAYGGGSEDADDLATQVAEELEERTDERNQI